MGVYVLRHARDGQVQAIDNSLFLTTPARQTNIPLHALFPVVDKPSRGFQRLEHRTASNRIPSCSPSATHGMHPKTDAKRLVTQSAFRKSPGIIEGERIPLPYGGLSLYIDTLLHHPLPLTHAGNTHSIPAPKWSVATTQGRGKSLRTFCAIHSCVAERVNMSTANAEALATPMTCPGPVFTRAVHAKSDGGVYPASGQRTRAHEPARTPAPTPR